MYKIYDLYSAYNIDKNSKYLYNEIKSFFEINKKVLFLVGEELENELAYNWTHDKFIVLLESIFYLNKNDIILNVNVASSLSLGEIEGGQNNEQELNYIQKTIFTRNSFEELYNKFIIPKSILEKDIDYGYSEINKKYIANLTSSVTDINDTIDVLKDVFEFNKSTSLERRRSMRKKGLELIIAGLFKNPKIQNDKDFLNTMYKMFDDGLQKEINTDTDKEYGSLHNVLYGFISHSNIYKTSYIKYGNNSHYQFIKFIPELLKLLNNNLLTK